MNDSLRFGVADSVAEGVPKTVTVGLGLDVCRFVREKVLDTVGVALKLADCVNIGERDIVHVELGPDVRESVQE